jgi:hypothetical protein
MKIFIWGANQYQKTKEFHSYVPFVVNGSTAEIRQRRMIKGEEREIQNYAVAIYPLIPVVIVEKGAKTL